MSIFCEQDNIPENSNGKRRKGPSGRAFRIRLRRIGGLCVRKTATEIKALPVGKVHEVGEQVGEHESIRRRYPMVPRSPADLTRSGRGGEPVRFPPNRVTMS